MVAITQTCRLVVLIPDYRENTLALAQKIFWIASQSHSRVLYLTLARPGEDELAMARAMTTLSAQTAGPWLTVQWQNARAAGWLDALRAVYRPGDHIICHAEQAEGRRLGRSIPLSEAVQRELGAPMLVLAGFHRPRTRQPARRSNGLVTWLGFFIILALFSWLEFELDLVTGGVLGRFIVIVAVLLEFGVVLAWNRIS